MPLSPQTKGPQVAHEQTLHCLTTHLIRKIDDAVCRAGQYGEVRLVIVKGELRYIQVMVSETVGDQKRGGDREGQ